MTSLRLVSWCWSQEGNVKLNVDGSSWGNFGQAGFGGLLRGVDGRSIVRFKGSMGFADNLLPELMVICMGLRLPWERAFRNVSCELDSLEAIRLISTDEEDHCYMPIVKEIKNWLYKDWRVSLSHVHREAP